MSNRTLRVNELVQRELSAILRQKYQSESVAVTITSVRVAPDLRDGRVYVSVMGDETVAAEKLRWLKKQAHDIRFELGRRIVLKYMPQLTYVLDQSTAQGNRVMRLLDEIAEQHPDEPEHQPDESGQHPRESSEATPFS